MRTSPYFRKLLHMYENPRLRGSSLFERMVNNAKTFADWNEIHRYGDNAYQSMALEKMKSLVLDGKKVLDIQKNILDLFELIADSSEHETILKQYLEVHAEKDDLLFILSVCPYIDDFWREVQELALKYYSTEELWCALDAIDRKNVRIMS